MSHHYDTTRHRHVWTCDLCGITYEDRGNWRRCLDNLKALGWRVVENGRWHVCPRCRNFVVWDPPETSREFSGTEEAA